MSEVLWNRLTAAELRALAARDAVVLLPIGATEQHGPHLPTGVDDFLAAEVCRRAAVLAADLVASEATYISNLTGHLHDFRAEGRCRAARGRCLRGTRVRLPKTWPPAPGPGCPVLPEATGHEH